VTWKRTAVEATALARFTATPPFSWTRNQR
jgi:hypothetical protein